MWAFMLAILALTLYFLMGDLIHEHVPALSVLFPSKTAAPQAVPSEWRLELAPGTEGNTDYRLSLLARTNRAGISTRMVLTCVGGKFFAHIDPGAQVSFRHIDGGARSDVVFDGGLRRSWEQGSGNLLFPPNQVWFVEKALASRDKLTMEFTPKDSEAAVKAEFLLKGLEMYSGILAKCGVNLPLATPDSAQPQAAAS